VHQQHAAAPGCARRAGGPASAGCKRAGASRTPAAPPAPRPTRLRSNCAGLARGVGSSGPLPGGSENSSPSTITARGAAAPPTHSGWPCCHPVAHTGASSRPASLLASAVDRQLRVGADAGGEQRAVVHRQVVHLPVRPSGRTTPGFSAWRPCRSRPSRGRCHLGQQRLHAAAARWRPWPRPMCGRARPVRAPGSPAWRRRQTGSRPCSAARGARRPSRSRERVVQHGEPSPRSLTWPPTDCSWKPSRSSASRHMGVRELASARPGLSPKPGRVGRRSPGAAAAPPACSRWGRPWAGSSRKWSVYMRLRRALPALDRSQTRRPTSPPGAGRCAAQAPCGSGQLGAHQQGRRVDGATGQHDSAWPPRAPRCCTAPHGWARCWACTAHALQGLTLPSDVPALGARLHQQRGATVQRGRDGGDQHGLLGVGGAAHAAGAQVPAALDVARMASAGCPASRATAQQFVVLVGRHQPGPMFSRVSACWKVGGQRPRRCNPSGRSARCQKASVAGGVRKELVQLTVVEPPTQRPCRMVMPCRRSCGGAFLVELG
jgi:hypothetical protein